MENIKHLTLDSRESTLNKPTHEAVLSVAEYDNLDISVGIIDARLPDIKTGEMVGRTIVWPQSYASRLDKFELQRSAVIAEALNARVITAELPGVGISLDAKSSNVQKIEMLGGSFDQAAYSMLGAINEIVDFKNNEEVELLLYSQGNAVGSYILSNLEDEAFGLKLKVPRITMIEAVNDQSWNLVKLLKAINDEDAHTNRFLNENNRFDWALSPNDRTDSGKIEVDKLSKRQMINLALAGIALGKAFSPVLIRSIEKDRSGGVTGISGSQIDILKFDASGVSREDENKLTCGQLNRVMSCGEVSYTILEAPKGQGGLNHPAIHSLPIVEVLSRDVLTKK